MAINQKQVLSLQQKLSPQQIQMIKLLELPTVQLEQRIKQEIEDNIVLEEEDRAAEDEEQPQQISVDEYLREDDTPSYKSRINNYSKGFCSFSSFLQQCSFSFCFLYLKG